MFKFLKQLNGVQPAGNLVDTLIHTEQSLQSLPELSAVEKVQLEQEIAISHLYHSSKIEGSNLNTERLEKAIHA